MKGLSTLMTHVVRGPALPSEGELTCGEWGAVTGQLPAPRGDLTGQAGPEVLGRSVELESGPRAASEVLGRSVEGASGLRAAPEVLGRSVEVVSGLRAAPEVLGRSVELGSGPRAGPEVLGRSVELGSGPRGCCSVCSGISALFEAGGEGAQPLGGTRRGGPGALHSRVCGGGLVTPVTAATGPQRGGVTSVLGCPP